MDIKVPFYHIVNMLLTGLVLIGALTALFPEMSLSILNAIAANSHAIPETIVVVFLFAAAYEAGLIVNRLGSVVIEPVLRRLKLIKFNDDYVLFNNKKKEHPILGTLSREFALSRTGFTLFLILTLPALLSQFKLLSVAFCAIALLYFFSCKKHAEKIVTLMSESQVPISNKK